MGKEGPWSESESVSSTPPGRKRGHALCADKGDSGDGGGPGWPEHCHLPSDLAVRPREALLPLEWGPRLSLFSETCTLIDFQMSPTTQGSLLLPLGCSRAI